MAQSKQAQAQGLGRYVIPLMAAATLMLIGTIAVFSYVAYVDNNRLQWRLATAQIERMVPDMMSDAVRAAGGNADAATALQAKILIFDTMLENLKKGNPADRMPPLKDSFSAKLGFVMDNWVDIRPKLEAIAGAESVYTSVNDAAAVIDQEVQELSALSDEVVQSLLRVNTAPTQIYLAQRQSFLIVRIKAATLQLVRASAFSSVALEKLGRDAALFERSLDAMLTGKEGTGLQKVEDPAARDVLRQMAVKYSAVREAVQVVLAEGPQLIEAGRAFEQADMVSTTMIATTSVLNTAVIEEHDSLASVTVIGYVLAIATLLFVALLGVVLVRDSRRREAVTSAQNERNQQAILRLLDEMMNLAEGDLSQHTTVTEDITGAIADSVNYSIDALRDLVSTMKRTSVQVSEAANDSRDSSLRLSASSQEQAEEIEQASELVSVIAQKVGQVAENAQTSADVAASSMDVARKGGEAVRQTIQGMEGIREQIQDTSKRLKRLGESSQEVGDIVGLITDIADQTNILALNAAIQAAMAGDAGRGFAVVADEVQRLAERVGNATKQIESLVKTIQSDTQEAMLSMEQTTTNVVAGAQIAENAGRSLEEIESVSSSLAEQIRVIAQAAREQLDEAGRIRETMSRISEETNVSAMNSQVSANKVGQLTDLAQELQNSVAGFKLPDAE
ncbi:MAG: methyl-accepting chemotaxis protein [Halothiobacillaceae bacterium]|nr:methyl-accepting chemotaxis protein [Halothiobacillaceae bacterium]